VTLPAVGIEIYNLRSILPGFLTGCVTVQRIMAALIVVEILEAKETAEDVRTPMRGRESKRPVRIDDFATYAEPLRCLDYLLEDIQPAALLYENGIMIDVTGPTRYAIHKCVVPRSHQEDTEASSGAIAAGFRGTDPRYSRAATMNTALQLNRVGNFPINTK